MNDGVTDPVGFGVIGANSFVANAAVLPAIVAGRNTRLAATASRSSDVPAEWATTDVGSYEAVLDHPDVDAVYIPLPNGMHREWTEKAAAAGKHVLCEKPLASDSATARAMADACDRAGVILAEAWMTPFSNRYRHVLDRAARGDIGTIARIDSRFTFTIGAGNDSNYRWDPDQGGGALLDVGIYCLGPIVELFGSMPTTVLATRSDTTRGVDARTSAEMHWEDDRVAHIACSFVDEESQTLTLNGTGGRLRIGNEAFTGGPDGRTFHLGRTGAQDAPVPHHALRVEANDSYQAMVEAFADAVRGRAEWPRPAERSIEMLELIERIRDAATD